MLKKIIKILFGRFDGDECPYCGSTNTDYDEWHRDWCCRSCGKYF